MDKREEVKFDGHLTFQSDSGRGLFRFVLVPKDEKEPQITIGVDPQDLISLRDSIHDAIMEAATVRLIQLLLIPKKN